MLPHPTTLLHHLRRLTCPPLGDAALLARWIDQRDEEAFAALVARHGPMVLGVCQRVLGNCPDAEDVFQATFLILARKAASLRRPEALAGWLHGVAARLARKTRAITARRRIAGPCSPTLEPADPHPDPLDLLTVRELLGLLDREVSGLPEVYRLPVVLCDLEGRTQEETAGLLGWTLGSVRGRLLRGRARLKARLTRRGLALPAGAVLPMVPAALSAPLQAAGPVLTSQRVMAVTRAAIGFSTRPTTAELSGRVVELAKEGLRGMMLTRLKIAAAAVVMMSVFVAGAGLLARPGRQAKPAEEQRENKAPPTQASTPKKPTDEKNAVRLDRYGDALPDGAVARLGTVRFRHGYTVSAVAFAPDRMTLVSGGQDNTVRLWELATGKEIRRFTAVTGLGSDHAWVQSVAFSPDGKLLAAGTGNGPGEVVVWDLTTSKEKWRFKEIQRPVMSVAFSPDGKTLAAGAVDALVHLWDVASGEALRKLKGHEQMIESIAYSADGTMLASASRDKTARLWDPATGRELRQLKGHTDMVLSVAFARDGKTLASGSWDNTIRLWDTATGKELRVLKGHAGAVDSLVFLPDGKTLASGSWDGSARLWDTAAGKELRQMQGHRGPVPSIVVSKDGKTIASGSWDRTVRLWDVVSGKELRPTEGHHHGLWSVTFSPDGKQVATGGEDDGTVRLWESDTGREIHRLHGVVPGISLGLVDRLIFSADGKTLSAATWGWKMYRWDTATGKLLGERRYDAIGLIPTPHGKFVVGGDAQGNFHLMEATTGKKIRSFKTQGRSAAAALSSDGKFLATGSPEENGTMVVWELATGKERCRCKGAPHLAQALAFSPDGKYLAGSTANMQVYTPESPIYLWDAATGREIRQFRGHENHVASLVFSSDSRTLVSGAGDNTIRLWEVATGKERRRFAGHQGHVHGIALSPDGSRVASASYDTTALIWDATGLEANGRREPAGGNYQALWADLAGDDAAKAYRAVWLLARNPEQGVPLLRKHLPPARALEPEQRKQVERWLMDLDSDEAAVRERSSAELEKLSMAVEPILRKTLAGRPSLEQRKRIERLLERLEREQVTLGRAIEALEYASTAESRRLLETLAEGESGAWLTREAKAALQRAVSRTRKE